MQRIPRIEESPAIVNGRAGGRELWFFLERVHSHLTEDDPRFPFYLTWLAESASVSARSRMMPSSLPIIKDRLERTDSRNQNFDQELTEKISEDVDLTTWRFSVVYVLCKTYIELGEISNAIDVVEKYRDEFQDVPLYSILRGEILVQQGTQENADKALNSVWRAYRENPDWSEIKKGVAAVIVGVLERDLKYNGYNKEIPTDRDSLLQKAKEAIEDAITEVPDHPEYLFIKGRVQALDGRFAAARQNIRRAIEHLSQRRVSYDKIHTQYRIELSNVDIKEQEYRLRTETSSAIKQLDDLRQDYKDASQKFQTRTLQFLGFFTGLIGIVVITAQTAISVDSTAASIRLILVMIGALLFAFGGFGFILPTQEGDRINLRIFGVLVSGAILILTGALL